MGRLEIDALVKRHYLHRWPGVVVCNFALLDGGMAIGCMVFALPPRETMKRYGVNLAWELARLFIDDGTPKNSETWFMSRVVQLVRIGRPDVELLVSYADPSAGHIGTIYKAGNWIADGHTDQERKSPRCDYVAVATGKHYSRKGHVPSGVRVERVPRVSKFRYIYWLNRRHEQMRQNATRPPWSGTFDNCAQRG